MSKEESYEQAAAYYHSAGLDLEAARCYQLAGAHRRAAEVYETANQLDLAAAAFADAGLAEFGAWLLVHNLGRPADARALLDAKTTGGTADGSPGSLGPWPKLKVEMGTRWHLNQVLHAGSEYIIGLDPQADITVDGPGIGWRHARVRTDKNIWVYEDLGTPGGSYIDHTRERITRVEIPLTVTEGIRLGQPDDGGLLLYFNHATVSEDEWDPAQRASSLHHRLVLARCELAEGAPADSVRPVIADACTALADTSTRSDQVTEEWAVAVSQVAGRYDQAALVFAAAVRGGRHRAAERWQAWAERIFGTEIVLPPMMAN